MPDMRTYLLTAPRWAVGLSSGLFLGIGIAVVTRELPTSWLVAVVTGVVSGVLLGAVMAFTIGLQRRDLRAAAGDLPAAQLLDAYRAAVRGPIPADPQVRAAAARVAQRLLQAARPSWILSLALAILLTVGAAMNTTDGNYRLAALLGAAALANASEVYELSRLRRRVGRLSP